MSHSFFFSFFKTIKLAKLRKELYEEKKNDVKISISMNANIEKTFWAK